MEKYLESIIIKNGKIIKDDGYKKDFHEFIDYPFLNLLIPLPGINYKTLIIKILEELVQITVYINKQFYNLFGYRRIKLSGKISHQVEPSFYLTDYVNGILIIKLKLIESEL